MHSVFNNSRIFIKNKNLRDINTIMQLTRTSQATQHPHKQQQTTQKANTKQANKQTTKEKKTNTPKAHQSKAEATTSKPKRARRKSKPKQRQTKNATATQTTRTAANHKQHNNPARTPMGGRGKVDQATKAMA